MNLQVMGSTPRDVPVDARSALMLGVFLSVSYTAALPGALFPPGEWYESLTKPALTPPNWLFPLAWTALFALMAVAAWMVWRRAGFRGAAAALGLFAVQLILNGAWSWVFFHRQEMGWALVELAVLWTSIAATMVAFWRIRPLAGALLVPYLAWVSFAGYLNWGFWALNP